MKLICGFAAIALSASLAMQSSAQVVHFTNNFDALTPNTLTVGPANYVAANDIAPGWQIQGGDGPGGLVLTAAVDALGVGGTQGFSGTWDSTNSASGGYTYNQYTVYGVPLQAATNVVNLVRVSVDIFMSGSSTNNPIDVVYQFSNGSMEKVFKPTLTNNAFTHVSFTLNQATGPDPNFAVDTSFNFRLQHGAGGFGFDAGNVVRMDNVVIDTVAANADFDGSGRVDGNDYLIWQRGLGTTPTSQPWLSGDANGDSIIDGADLAAWQLQYGQTVGVTASIGAVPEPTAALLAAIACIAFARKRKR